MIDIARILRTAIHHCDVAIAYGEDQETRSDALADAAGLRIVAVYENIAKLPESIQGEILGEDIHALRGMRNRIVHGYETVDSFLLRNTLTSDVPRLRQALITVAKRYPQDRPEG